jgi:hypothetical protein
MALFPIEIKAGQTVSNDYFKQFDYWKEHVGGTPEQCFVVYTGAATAQWSKAKVIAWHDAGELIMGLVTRS